MQRFSGIRRRLCDRLERLFRNVSHETSCYVTVGVTYLRVCKQQWATVVPYEKGQSGNPNGRRSGSTNKATKNAREAIADFVDGNADRLNGWLDAIAAKDPEKAFHCLMSVVEYHIPKLARTDTTVTINSHEAALDELK